MQGVPTTREALRLQIADKLRAAGADEPDALVDALMAQALPCVGFVPDDAGASVLAGDPVLPLPVGWPTRPAVPDPKPLLDYGVEPDRVVAFLREAAEPASLTHVATVDLGEVAATGVAGALPGRGRLLFFYDMEWGPNLPATFAGRVVWDEGVAPPERLRRPADLLARAAHWDDAMIAVAAQDDPASAEDDDLANPFFRPARPVRAVARWLVPDDAVLALASVTGEAARERLRLALRRGDGALSGTHLLGPPTGAGSDPRLAAVAAIDRGVPALDRAASVDDDQLRRRRADDLAVLAQFALADVQGPRSTGALFFLIPRDALAAQRFEAAVAVADQI